MIFCQSCAMPLGEGSFGSNEDGPPPCREYCSYCYSGGRFAADVSMEQMIEHCLQYLDEFNKDSEKKYTVGEARAQMLGFFPTLRRWRKG